MELLSELFGIASGIVGLIGYAPYVRDIWKGSTQPDRVAWLIWTFEYAALFFAQASAGAQGSLWLIGLQLIGVVIIFGLSLKFGIGKFTIYTSILLVAILGSLVLWHTTKNAALAICLLLAVEASGVVLTAIKTYKKPRSETLSLWCLIALAGLLGIPAVGGNAAAILYLYPISLVIMSLSVIGASYMGARKARMQQMVLSESSNL